jgi:hypothetical protein
MPGVLLPPGFAAIACDGDPMAAAVRQIEAGAAPGTILHAPLARHCRVAIILTPDRPIADTQSLALAAQAVHAALAGLAPAGVPIAVKNNRILVNGAEAATLRLRRPGQNAECVPEWLVLGIDVAVDLGDPDPGHDVLHTCLAEEGFTCSAAELLAGICRHLLSAIHELTDQTEAA